jgi:preprotein translocase subunit SecE
MCAQRKPAVKDAKEQSTAKTTQAVSKQVRSAGSAAKQPAQSQPKRQEKEKEKEKSVLAQRGERIAQSVRDTRAEMKKVSWPDKETTRNLTLLVIGMTTALGLLLGGIDFVLLKLFEWL